MTNHIEGVAAELLKHNGESLVVSGSNDPDCQQIINSINHLLGNYGKTVDMESPSMQSKSDDREFAELIREMKAGEVSALVMLDVNPAYDSYSAPDFAEGLKKVPLKISFNPSLDETASLADYVCPAHQFVRGLERRRSRCRNIQF